MIKIDQLREQFGDSLRTTPSPLALARWNPDLRAEASGDSATDSISIMDVIGYDPWTGGGVTARRIDAALRRIGENKKIDVYINSPGGDVFEGSAIYSLLDAYKGEIVTHVVGLAASAASLIAIAGKQRTISRAGMIMVHDAWGLVVGNRHDMKKAFDVALTIDEMLASVYAHHTGLDEGETLKMMDEETWLNAKTAVDKNFATEVVDNSEVEDKSKDTSKNALKAIKRVDLALAQAGLTRSERRALLQELKGDTPSAMAEDMQNAVDNVEPLSFDFNF